MRGRWREGLGSARLELLGRGVGADMVGVAAKEQGVGGRVSLHLGREVGKFCARPAGTEMKYLRISADFVAKQT